MTGGRTTAVVDDETGAIVAMRIPPSQWEAPGPDQAKRLTTVRSIGERLIRTDAHGSRPLPSYACALTANPGLYNRETGTAVKWIAWTQKPGGREFLSDALRPVVRAVERAMMPALGDETASAQQAMVSRMPSELTGLMRLNINAVVNLSVATAVHEDGGNLEGTISAVAVFHHLPGVDSTLVGGDLVLPSYGVVLDTSSESGTLVLADFTRLLHFNLPIEAEGGAVRAAVVLYTNQRCEQRAWEGRRPREAVEGSAGWAAAGAAPCASSERGPWAPGSARVAATSAAARGAASSSRSTACETEAGVAAPEDGAARKKARGRR